MTSQSGEVAVTDENEHDDNEGGWAAILQEKQDEDGQMPPKRRKNMAACEMMLLEPSSTLRLHGFVNQWHKMTGYGFIESSGISDVSLNSNDLPPEVRGKQVDLLGADVSFVLEVPNKDVRLATDVHLLLDSGGREGWQLSRRGRKLSPLKG